MKLYSQCKDILYSQCKDIKKCTFVRATDRRNYFNIRCAPSKGRVCDILVHSTLDLAPRATHTYTNCRVHYFPISSSPGATQADTLSVQRPSTVPDHSTCGFYTQFLSMGFNEQCKSILNKIFRYYIHRSKTLCKHPQNKHITWNLIQTVLIL